MYPESSQCTFHTICVAWVPFSPSTWISTNVPAERNIRNHAHERYVISDKALYCIEISQSQRPSEIPVYIRPNFMDTVSCFYNTDATLPYLAHCGIFIPHPHIPQTSNIYGIKDFIHLYIFWRTNDFPCCYSLFSLRKPRSSFKIT